MKRLIEIALAVFIFNALFWKDLSVIWFYRLWAIYFFLLILYIWKEDKLNFSKFFLFEASIYNIIDEFTSDGSIVKKEHALVLIVIPFIWYIKKIFKKW